MLDLTGISPAERVAMRKELLLNMTGAGSSMKFIEKIAWAQKINSNVAVVTPGLEGVGLARSRPDGAAITLNALKLRKKTLELQDLDNSYAISKKEIRDTDNIMDVTNEIARNFVPAWADSIHAAMVEYMTDNAGKWDVLDVGTDILGADGLSMFNNNKYDGALDNTYAQTGTSVADITHDFWALYNQLLVAKIPGTNRFFWGGQTLKDMELVIMYPVELNEQMQYIFNAEQFLTTIGGVSYDSPMQNLLAKEGYVGKPTLVPSGYLSEISTTDWYVFFTPRSVPGTQAFSLFFNPDMSTAQNANRGSDILTFGQFDANGPENNDFFTLEYLGNGSDIWVREKKAIITSGTSLAILGAQPYRCGYVG